MVVVCTRRAKKEFFYSLNGDAQLVKELAEKNKKSAVRFCYSVGYAVALHVIAGLIVF